MSVLGWLGLIFLALVGGVSIVVIAATRQRITPGKVDDDACEYDGWL